MQQVIFSTVGDGYWSNVAKPVLVTDMQLGYVSDDRDYAELCVYFDTKFWDVSKDGLIYTDSNFIAELNAFLAAHGLPAASYSEQGMQGDNYVSLDVEADFVAAWDAKFNTVLA
jgi:hypothetical protein